MAIGISGSSASNITGASEEVWLLITLDMLLRVSCI